MDTVGELLLERARRGAIVVENYNHLIDQLAVTLGAAATDRAELDRPDAPGAITERDVAAALVDVLDNIQHRVDPWDVLAIVAARYSGKLEVA